ncbi:MAG: CHAD domain-containing protein [Bacteroidota bacterium]
MGRKSAPGGGEHRALEAHVSASLERRWRAYCRELDRCRRGFAEESVHDLRVAIRRLLSALDMLGVLSPDGGLRRMRRSLRRRLDAFGPLRDIQVQSRAVARLGRDHPLLGPLATILALRERRAVRRLERTVGSITTAEDEKVLLRARTQAEALLALPGVSVSRRNALTASAAAAFAAAIQRRLLVDPEDAATIHLLRLAFKRFRYRLEILEGLLPWVTRDLSAAMHAYQLRMGEVQDAAVLLEMVRAYTPPTATRARAQLGDVRRVLEKRRSELIGAFLEKADELYGFWKGPVHPYVG